MNVMLIPPSQFRINGQNIALFVDSRFLLLPVSEVELVAGGSVKVSKENLDAALDVTPDLPPRVVGLAWKHGVLFGPIDPVWAKDVAAAAKMSATSVIRAFEN